MSEAFTYEMDLAGEPRSGYPQNDFADDETEHSVQLPEDAKITSLPADTAS